MFITSLPGLLNMPQLVYASSSDGLWVLLVLEIKALLAYTHPIQTCTYVHACIHTHVYTHTQTISPQLVMPHTNKIFSDLIKYHWIHCILQAAFCSVSSKVTLCRLPCMGSKTFQANIIPQLKNKSAFRCRDRKLMYFSERWNSLLNGVTETNDVIGIRQKSGLETQNNRYHSPHDRKEMWMYRWPGTVLTLYKYRFWKWTLTYTSPENTNNRSVQREGKVAGVQVTKKYRTEAV